MMELPPTSTPPPREVEWTQETVYFHKVKTLSFIVMHLRYHRSSTSALDSITNPHSSLSIGLSISNVDNDDDDVPTTAETFSGPRHAVSVSFNVKEFADADDSDSARFTGKSHSVISD